MTFDIMIPKLSKDDIEKIRTQEEFRRWADDLDSALGSTEEGVRAVRLNKGHLVKQFYEEAWPLALYADAFYAGRVDVVFQSIIGNQSYDALILDKSDLRIIQCLQLTQTFDGYQRVLKMLHLEKYDWAPATGPPLRKTPGVEDIGEYPLITTDFNDGLDAELQKILMAVQRKSMMRYESNTSLIVVFEDDYISRDYEALNRFVREQVLPVIPRFESLCLISDRSHFSFHNERCH